MLASGFLLGLGLASIFWMPALAEWHLIHWIPLHNHIAPLSLPEILSAPRPHDPALFNPPLVQSVGLATWGLWLVGSIWVLIAAQRQQTRANALAVLPFMLASLGLLGLATWPDSAWLDQQAKFPGLSRHDLLALAVAPAAVVGGQAGAALEQGARHGRARLIGISLLAILLCGSSYPSLVPPPFSVQESADVREEHLQAELRGVMMGSFPDGQLLPRQIRRLPAPSPSLLDSLRRGQPDKLERVSRLPRSELAVISHGPTHDTFRIVLDGPQQTVLPVLTLNFAGWHAQLNSERMPIQSSTPSGLIEITVPPNSQGDLQLRLRETPVRRLSTLVTLVCGVVLGIAVLIPRRRNPLAVALPTLRASSLALLYCSLLILGFIAGRQFPASAAVAGSIQPVPLVFEGGVDLLGYRLDRDALQAGERVPLHLFWQAARPNLPDYATEVRLVEQQSGNVVERVLHRYPGGWATSSWRLQRYVQDTFWLRLPRTAAPGTYVLEVRVYRCQNPLPALTCEGATPLNVFEQRGALVGQRALLPPRFNRG
ncbi:MAG: hypothetical protein HC915_06745 [Anaerolineae bacterium]|nr:hypothetical protein [Anaerolineae bacterium]